MGPTQAATIDLADLTALEFSKLRTAAHTQRRVFKAILANPTFSPATQATLVRDLSEYQTRRLHAAAVLPPAWWSREGSPDRAIVELTRSPACTAHNLTNFSGIPGLGPNAHASVLTHPMGTTSFRHNYIIAAITATPTHPNQALYPAHPNKSTLALLNTPGLDDDTQAFLFTALDRYKEITTIAALVKTTSHVPNRRPPELMSRELASELDAFTQSLTPHLRGATPDSLAVMRTLIADNTALSLTEVVDVAIAVGVPA